MSIDIEKLTAAMNTGDSGLISSALGFTIDPSTVELLDRLGWAERENAELVAKVKWQAGELKKRDWIPCSERFPDDNRDVLIYQPGADPEVSASRYEHDCWLVRDAHTASFEITQWSELPQPPEMGS